MPRPRGSPRLTSSGCWQERQRQPLPCALVPLDSPSRKCGIRERYGAGLVSPGHLWPAKTPVARVKATVSLSSAGLHLNPIRPGDDPRERGQRAAVTSTNRELASASTRSSSCWARVPWAPCTTRTICSSNATSPSRSCFRSSPATRNRKLASNERRPSPPRVRGSRAGVQQESQMGEAGRRHSSGGHPARSRTSFQLTSCLAPSIGRGTL